VALQFSGSLVIVADYFQRVHARLLEAGVG
jgi:hypothetical protein